MSCTGTILLHTKAGEKSHAVKLVLENVQSADDESDSETVGSGVILKDEHGEVEVGIGDFFEFQGAKFSVICPEDIHQRNGLIWVRLKSGALEVHGKRYEIRADGSEDLREPVLPFTGELVASCIREHRLMTFDIPAPPVQPPARIEKKSPRAPTRKKGAQEHGPTTGTLF